MNTPKKLNTDFISWPILQKLIRHLTWKSLDDKSLISTCNWFKVINYENGDTEVFGLDNDKSETFIGILSNY